jgi:site-specific DNA-methyltransferase (adenine-specific)
MRTLDENSVDTCITDPPYELGFMGKKWDSSGIAFQPDTWAEVYRVLKPGALLLAFGGTRTYHRLVCAIEDAGFEIRDTIAWVYGSGFPKSYDISKGIDKKAGAEREVVGAEKLLEPSTKKPSDASNIFMPREWDITAPSTPEAQLWDGWGTALKPAFEPIVVAMKPVDGTFVNNALTWGVAGLWIDGGRVETSDNLNGGAYSEGTPEHMWSKVSGGGGFERQAGQFVQPQGRFPANFVHDGSDEVTGLFPMTTSGGGDKGRVKFEGKDGILKDGLKPIRGNIAIANSGSAARFFYCAKSSRRERNNGLDGYLTVKYNNDKSNNGGLSWKDVSTVAVQLLRKVISDTEALSFNIGESGESITGQCLKDSLSTILTAISKTIESKILHSLTLSLTNEYTAGVNYEMVNGGSPAESVESLRKWILTTTNGSMELARGASNVALQMLLRTKNADAWSQATNFHSTVKPISLMRYLVRLTKTPTGGVVLDPFMGSGTTGCACALEGRDFIGIEREQDYFAIAEKRIAEAQKQPKLELE